MSRFLSALLVAGGLWIAPGFSGTAPAQAAVIHPEGSDAMPLVSTPKERLGPRARRLERERRYRRLGEGRNGQEFTAFEIPDQFANGFNGIAGGLGSF